MSAYITGLQRIPDKNNTQTSYYFYAVAGNANFDMKWTCLTLCGLTQPATALPLIVDKNNVDKGLASRFLWVFPKPVISTFASLNINQNAECQEDADQFQQLLGKPKKYYLSIIVSPGFMVIVTNWNFQHI